MTSSERRGNDRAFPACVTNLQIIATTHHRRGHDRTVRWRSGRAKLYRSTTVRNGSWPC